MDPHLPGLAPPVEPLFPVLTNEDQRREQLRRARQVAAVAAVLALVAALGWFREARDPAVDARTHADVVLALDSWARLQASAAAQNSVDESDLSAAGVLPAAPGVREDLELARETRQAPERYILTKIRSAPGGVLLVEANWTVFTPDEAWGQDYFMTFARDEHGRLQMVATAPDPTDGI